MLGVFVKDPFPDAEGAVEPAVTSVVGLEAKRGGQPPVRRDALTAQTVALGLDPDRRPVVGLEHKRRVGRANMITVRATSEAVRAEGAIRSEHRPAQPAGEPDAVDGAVAASDQLSLAAFARDDGLNVRPVLQLGVEQML